MSQYVEERELEKKRIEFVEWQRGLKQRLQRIGISPITSAVTESPPRDSDFKKQVDRRLRFTALLWCDMKTDMPREQETIEVWNVCECGRILHSIAEGKRGTCSGCWVNSMPSDTKTALNKLIGAAFRNDKPSDDEKDELIDDAMAKLDRDSSSP